MKRSKKSEEKTKTGNRQRREGEETIDRLMAELFEHMQKVAAGDVRVPRKPTDTNICHVTLNSCHRSYVPGGSVPDELRDEYKRILTAERIHPIGNGTNGTFAHVPKSNKRLQVMVSDAAHPGDLSISILSDRKVVLLARCYAGDKNGSETAWLKLVQTFAEVGPRTWPGFNATKLVDTPDAPWLGVIVLDESEESRLLLHMLLSVEQAIAVAWCEVCEERKGAMKSVADAAKRRGQ